MLSKQAWASIPTTIVGQPVTVHASSPQREARRRHFHGLVGATVPAPAWTSAATPPTGWRRCRALWNLGRRVNCRIFQKKKPDDIVKTMLREGGAEPVRSTSRPPPRPREYCTQFNESDLDFTLRILEENGWGFFFRHDQRQHTLHVVDSKPAIPSSPASPTPCGSGWTSPPPLWAMSSARRSCPAIRRLGP